MNAIINEGLYLSDHRSEDWNIFMQPQCFNTRQGLQKSYWVQVSPSLVQWSDG